jgi:predicted S18 family serine protease
MNLKNVFDKFKELKMAETLKRDINHFLERANLRKTNLEFYVKSLEEFVAQCKEGDEDYLEELQKEIKSCKNAVEEENEIISKMEDQLEKIK